MNLVLPVSGISVELSPMKYKDEKMLTDEKLVKQGKNYDHVIMSCAKFNGESPSEREILNLHSGDRNYILVYLRILSYGDEFEFDVKCPHCGKKNNYIVNLSELLENGGIQIVPKGESDTIDIALVDGGTATIGIPNGHRERRLINKAVNNGRVGKTDMTVVLIDQINGKDVTAAALENLTAKDLLNIRKRSNELIWGLKPIIKLPCDRCDENFDHIIISDQNFFNQ